MGYYPDEIENSLNTKAESIASKFLKNLIEPNSITLSRRELGFLKRFLVITKLRSRGSLEEIEHSVRVTKEEYEEHPEIVKISMGKYYKEALSDETPYDYWIRSMDCVLNEETGFWEELEKREDSTFTSVFFSKAFNAGYVGFWDAPDGKEFLINDSSFAYEREICFYTDGFNHKKIDMLKSFYDGCTDLCRKIEIVRLLEFNYSFFDNFYFFPISSKRMIVLINPFFKFLHEDVDNILTSHESVKDIEKFRQDLKALITEKITLFNNPYLTKPNECSYSNNNELEDIFRYEPKKLTLGEYHIVNTLIIGNTNEWIGFNNFSSVKSTFDYIKDNLPGDTDDIVKKILSIFCHADDEEYLRKLEKSSLKPIMSDNIVPEKFKFMMRKRIVKSFILGEIKNEHYPNVAASVVLSRNKFAQYGYDCNEDFVLNLLGTLPHDILDKYTMYYEKCNDEFYHCMYGVFTEIKSNVKHN